MDYLCAKFQVWRFYFQPFWFYRADRHTNRITDRKDRITEANQRYTHATIVGVRKYKFVKSGLQNCPGALTECQNAKWNRFDLRSLKSRFSL